MFTFTPEQTTKLLEVLGVPTDDDTVTADSVIAVAEDLAKQAAGAEGGKPSDIAAAAKRLGMETLDADTATALRAEAAEGRQLKIAAARQKVEAAVSTALEKGKITPARKNHWINLITADPAMADVLAAVADETAVPISEVGHTGGDDDGLTDEPGWFR